MSEPNIGGEAAPLISSEELDSLRIDQDAARNYAAMSPKTREKKSQQMESGLDERVTRYEDQVVDEIYLTLKARLFEKHDLPLPDNERDILREKKDPLRPSSNLLEADEDIEQAYKDGVITKFDLIRIKGKMENIEQDIQKKYGLALFVSKKVEGKYQIDYGNPIIPNNMEDIVDVMGDIRGYFQAREKQFVHLSSQTLMKYYYRRAGTYLNKEGKKFDKLMLEKKEKQEKDNTPPLKKW